MRLKNDCVNVALYAESDQYSDFYKDLTLWQSMFEAERLVFWLLVYNKVMFIITIQMESLRML